MAKNKRNVKIADVERDDEVTDEVSNTTDISNSTYSIWNPETKVMKSRYHVRKTQGGTKYTKVTEFDFSDCSEEQILQLAMYGVRVRAQSVLRDMEEPLMADPKTFSKVNVLKDLLSTQRTAITLEEKAIRALVAAGIPRDVAQKTLREQLATREAAAE